MTKVVALSDIHGMLPDPGEIPECDILIVAGDVCPDFASVLDGDYKGVHKQAKWLMTAFTSWVKDQPAKHTIVIGGNHDYVFESLHRGEYENTALRKHIWNGLYFLDEPPWIYLQDEVIPVEGLSIYGSPWVPNLPGWAFYASEQKIWDKMWRTPENVDILVTHGPPHGILDEGWRHGATLGSVACRDVVLKRKPTLHVFGHVHEAYGDLEFNGIHFSNVSRCTDRYEPINPIKEFKVGSPIQETE